jgi:predicted DNA-binding antitoxin AbrB/MazE fold protein
MATYKSGVFRPLDELKMSLEEGQAVRLTIEALPPPQSSLELLFHIYDGLSEEEIAEIEKIILDRSNFFPDRDWSWLDGEDVQDEGSTSD